MSCRRAGRCLHRDSHWFVPYGLSCRAQLVVCVGKFNLYTVKSARNNVREAVVDLLPPRLPLFMGCLLVVFLCSFWPIRRTLQTTGETWCLSLSFPPWTRTYSFRARATRSRRCGTSARGSACKLSRATRVTSTPSCFSQTERWEKSVRGGVEGDWRQLVATGLNIS